MVEDKLSQLCAAQVLTHKVCDEQNDFSYP